MEVLEIKGTERTPNIIFDPKNKKFEISGISVPENVTEFYESAFLWLEMYANNPLESTIFKFNFDYFNTSSLKSFLIILSKLKRIKDAGKELIVQWCHHDEDDSMMEAGELLEELSEVKFEFISYSK
jgi:hypothetical protein